VRVCIIAPTNLYRLPYLSLYEYTLREAGVEFDVLYWDRRGLQEKEDEHYRCFSLHVGESLSMLSGLAHYQAFRRYVKSHLRERKYDYLIILTSLMGVVLADVTKRYPYILDIRDYTYERSLLFRTIENTVITRATLVLISSLGFLKWLPPAGRYLMAHNIMPGAISVTATPFPQASHVVSFIGASIHHYEAVRLLSSLVATSRYEMRIIGSIPEKERIYALCRDANIACPSIVGHYMPEEQSRYFHETNFVMAVYGDSHTNTRTLIPNKLYDSCIYRRPIIVSKGTYLGDYVQTRGIGLTVDLGSLEHIGELLDSYYNRDKYLEYCECCAIYLKEVDEDMKRLMLKLREVIGSKICYT
jgi:hypothetical protein